VEPVDRCGGARQLAGQGVEETRKIAWARVLNGANPILRKVSSRSPTIVTGKSAAW
jgi:hypothetical protein